MEASVNVACLHFRFASIWRGTSAGYRGASLAGIQPSLRATPRSVTTLRTKVALNHSRASAKTAGPVALIDPRDDAKMFDIAPVSLWLEDYSALLQLFDEWRTAGIRGLRNFLLNDPARVEQCSQCIRVLKVNQATLTLFEASSFDHLVTNLSSIFRGDMFATHVEELVQLWNGKSGFQSRTVNYSLGGRRIDIELKGTILEGYRENWSRVLVAIQDVTEREDALRRTATSDSYARGLFAHSPVSLWVEDFSQVKSMLDDLRQRGIDDFRTFTDVHPEFVFRCMSEIRVVDVNRHTLELFGAPDKETLLRRLNDVFRDEMHRHFREQLCDLWADKLFHRREVVNYALDGSELHLHMQFSVLPGYEKSWSLVQVALTDITARKKAEAYLEFLGKHDVLTKLCNRSFYADELHALERKAIAPVTIIMADLNGLKGINDEGGHAAGDGLLRRAGEIFAKAVDAPATAARIGGDEFAILMPHASEREGQAMIDSVRQIVELNNQFHSGAPLSFSLGMATSQAGERLENVARRADIAMYEAKRQYYQDAAERHEA